MAKFVYRMQSILDIKRKLEEQEKISYSLANARLREEEGKLQALVLRRAAYEKKARELVNGTIDLTEIAANRKAVETMKVLVRNQMMEVHRAEKDVEAARRRLTDVMQERKMQEKLREKAFDEFLQEIAYEENKAVDELVSYTYRVEEQPG